MAKFVKKEKLTWENGIFYYKKKPVIIDNEVRFLLEKLDRRLQLAQHTLMHEMFKTISDHDGDKFCYKKYYENEYIMDAPDTPELDDAIKLAKTICEQIEKKNKIERINEIIPEYRKLIDWVRADKIWIEKAGSEFPPINFNENPLEVDDQQIIEWIAATVDTVE